MPPPLRGAFLNNDGYTNPPRNLNGRGAFSSRGRGRGGNFSFGNRDGFTPSDRGPRRPDPGFGASVRRNFDEPSSVDWSEQLPRNERTENELFQKVNTGINFDLYDNITAKVSGPDVENISPIQSYDDISLTTIMHDNISSAQYVRPTPVQKYAIPIISAGRDLMACAQTGSGKTAAFLIPILNNMFEQGPGGSITACVCSYFVL